MIVDKPDRTDGVSRYWNLTWDLPTLAELGDARADRH